MKTAMWCCAWLVPVLFGGCASTSALRAVAYTWLDKPEDRVIEVRYRNDSGRRRCLLPEHWPNSAGAIADAEDSVFLVVGDRRFPMELFNSGYCSGGCSTVVASGEEISARIPYKHFDLPDELIWEPKKLEFSPLAFDCRAARVKRN